jgi:hypothetical protein
MHHTIDLHSGAALTLRTFEPAAPMLSLSFTEVSSGRSSSRPCGRSCRSGSRCADKK